MPEVTDRESRECIALDHQRKCLRKARQLHQALDIPAAPPPNVTMHLYAGDCAQRSNTVVLPVAWLGMLALKLIPHNMEARGQPSCPHLRIIAQHKDGRT
jgi:hypothetical protein